MSVPFRVEVQLFDAAGVLYVVDVGALFKLAPIVVAVRTEFALLAHLGRKPVDSAGVHIT